jgi:hypothetical protein
MFAFGLMWLFTTSYCQAQVQPNTLTPEEIDGGWTLLFDGISPRGWKRFNHPDFPKSGWIVEKGILTIQSGWGGGDIVTVDQYSNYELQLEFRLTSRANSGIKYFVQPKSTLGLEYQILDDEHHPDAKKGVRGNRTVASLYDLIPAENKQVHPPGEWNQARIIVKGRRVEHWLNGIRVVVYDRGTQIFRALIAKSKYKDIPHFGLHQKGHILLQDHGDTVSFRNIKIRVLAPSEEEI